MYQSISFFSLSLTNDNMSEKKKENYRVPEIDSVIENMDKIVPVTAAEWNTIAEHHYTIFLNIAGQASL